MNWINFENYTLLFRPSFITLYIDDVDKAGHKYGPTHELNPQIKTADDMIGILMNGLRVRGLENCVNVIILSDHGNAFML